MLLGGILGGQGGLVSLSLRAVEGHVVDSAFFGAKPKIQNPKP